MGTIEFKGDTTFELKLQKEPRASALGANVVLTFPVFVADMPGQVAPVELRMKIPEAEWLAEILQVAISIARDNQRTGNIH
jgi:hypothetical protein